IGHDWSSDVCSSDLLVSQGAASVLSWVGVLYQRLHEISNGDLEGLAALVLIDEIDAYLHPALQRTLVPTLQKLFPNLQVVATTRSEERRVGKAERYR